MIIGVDPGLGGAIAFLYGGGSLEVFDMPIITEIKRGKKKRKVDVYALGNMLAGAIPEDHAYVELVHAMPGQGVTSMFNFGQSYGCILGALGAFNIPITYVRPQVWKGSFGLTSDKGLSLELARELFPKNLDDFKRAKDDGRAEAALIAYYGSRSIKS